MKKKSEIEMERTRAVKIARTLIRLKHSLAADVEMNERIPETLAEFDKAIANGELLSLKPTFEDIVGDA